MPQMKPTWKCDRHIDLLSLMLSHLNRAIYRPPKLRSPVSLLFRPLLNLEENDKVRFSLQMYPRVPFVRRVFLQ